VQQLYLNTLKELLRKLKDNQGYFIIQNEFLKASTNIGNEYYCQLVKDSPKGVIRFEALSHYFEKYVNRNLKPQFVTLGFSLEKDENYAKDILLNSENDVENTAKEISQIFEDIYNVDEKSIYYFDDQVEVVIEKSKKKFVSNNSASQPIQKPVIPKLSGCAWILIISLAFVVYAIFFNNDNDKKSTSSIETVYNSEWDASVQQVVDYLKNNYLNDPESYKPLEWSQVVKLNDTKQVGFASYQVRHKYRAKNALGAYVTEEKLFKLDYQGNVVEVRDWLK